MIHLSNIQKTYRVAGKTVPALAGIDLDIGEGEIFGIIGHSGAGKSTLIRLLNLLESPNSGQILIDGDDLTSLSRHALLTVRRRVGMVFQHFNLLSSRTVAANIRLPLELSGDMSRAEQNQRVDELLDLVGLTAFRNQYPRQLSGGQKQRVGIARALTSKPRLLLCDEATSALDPQTTQSILDLLADINHRLNLTIVLVTHEMGVVRRIADRVAVIDAGRIVEMGKIADVFLHPKHATTKSMVAELSHADELADSGLLAQAKGKVWRLTFVGEKTHQPILHDVSTKFQLSFALLQGTVARLKDLPYGQLVVEWQGDEQALKSAHAYLLDAGIVVEEIN